MCGICGYINFGKNRQDSLVLKNMVNTLHHRGPDSQGYFEDQEHQVFLGHARLSIIDISDNGKQPMSFGNLTIVFNGEIYNYQEIKKELSALGHSIYHFSNEGVCSWYDFTKMIADIAGNTTCYIQPCHSDEFSSPVKRPAYSVLDKTKIKKNFDIIIPYWVDSLKKCITLYNKSL